MYNTISDQQYSYRLDLTTPVMPSLPDYLSSIRHQNPTDVHKAAFNYAHATDLHWFDWIQQKPEIGNKFDEAMATTTALQKPSIQKDITSLLVQSSQLWDHDNEPILFVDVGGGRGQILADIRREQPGLKGRMIIQDLQGVVGDWQSPGDVEVMTYDFFNPQPVQGK